MYPHFPILFGGVEFVPRVIKSHGGLLLLTSKYTSWRLRGEWGHVHRTNLILVCCMYRQGVIDVCANLVTQPTALTLSIPASLSALGIAAPHSLRFLHLQQSSKLRIKDIRGFIDTWCKNPAVALDLCLSIFSRFALEIYSPLLRWSVQVQSDLKS